MKAARKPGFPPAAARKGRRRHLAHQQRAEALCAPPLRRLFNRSVLEGKVSIYTIEIGYNG